MAVSFLSKIDQTWIIQESKMVTFKKKKKMASDFKIGCGWVEALLCGCVL